MKKTVVILSILSINAISVCGRPVYERQDFMDRVNSEANLKLVFDDIDEGNYPRTLFLPWRTLNTVDGKDYQGDTPAHRAVRLGEKGDFIARSIVGRDLRCPGEPPRAGINNKNEDGDTLLHIVLKTAATGERSEESKEWMCLFLVNRGAKLDTQNDAKESPRTMDDSYLERLLLSREKLRKQSVDFRVRAMGSALLLSVVCYLMPNGLFSPLLSE